MKQQTSRGHAWQIERKHQQEQVQIDSVLKSLEGLHYPEALLIALPPSAACPSDFFCRLRTTAPIIACNAGAKQLKKMWLPRSAPLLYKMDRAFSVTAMGEP
jgi:hypothetical protein